jgi:hypothetical protein
MFDVYLRMESDRLGQEVKSRTKRQETKHSMTGCLDQALAAFETTSHDDCAQVLAQVLLVNDAAKIMARKKTA